MKESWSEYTKKYIKSGIWKDDIISTIIGIIVSICIIGFILSSN